MQIYDQQRPQDGWRAVKLHPAFSTLFVPPPPLTGEASVPAVPNVNGSEAFYVAIAGQQRGPMSSATLHGELLAGLIGPTTKVYSRPAHASLGWTPAADHPAIAEWFNVPPPPPD
jgi:hypothetical protein